MKRSYCLEPERPTPLIVLPGINDEILDEKIQYTIPYRFQQIMSLLTQHVLSYC